MSVYIQDFRAPKDGKCEAQSLCIIRLQYDKFFLISDMNLSCFRLCPPCLLFPHTTVKRLVLVFLICRNTGEEGLATFYFHGGHK